MPDTGGVSGVAMKNLTYIKKYQTAIQYSAVAFRQNQVNQNWGAQVKYL